jgi:hypothetical protein
LHPLITKMAVKAVSALIANNWLLIFVNKGY